MSRIFFLTIYILLVYSFIPFGRDVTDFLRENGLLRLTIWGTLALALAIFAGILFVSTRKARLRVILLVCATFAVYGALFSLISQPEERMHLIQFGLLVPITLWAFSARASGGHLHWRVFGFSAAIAVGDEFLQLLVPSRVFDWRDVGFNLLAVILGLVICRVFQQQHRA